MTDTPNHKYNRPAEGTTNWHIPLNENFKNLDVDVEIRDTEANKSDYDPKEGSKYEATDSGAVYYGDGDTWILANRKIKKLQAESVNDSWLTPQDHTIQAIQDLVDNYEHPHIKLEPGIRYEGDTQLYLDSTIKNDNGITVGGKDIVINARGAAVDYTGSKDTAVMIQQGNLLPSEPDIAESANNDTAGAISINYGSWIGPGRYIPGSAVFRQRPAQRCEIRPSSVQDAEHGILVEWYNGWNEGCHWGFRRGGGLANNKTGSDADTTLSRPAYLLRLAGDESELATEEWSAGYTGRSSGRNSDISIEYHNAANVDDTDYDDTVTFFQDHVALHGSQILLRGFVPDGGTQYRLRGNFFFNKYATMRIESEGGNSNSVVMDIGDNTHTPHILRGERFSTGGTTIKAEGNASVPTLNALGNARSHRPGSFKIKGDGQPANDDYWLAYHDGDKKPFGLSKVYAQGPGGGTLALKSHKTIKTTGAEGSNDPDIQAPNFSPSGDRLIKGSFDEHPSNVSNGDTWYITGNGGEAEGFYGQTASGVVKFG